MLDLHRPVHFRRSVSVVPLSASEAHHQLQDKRLLRPNSPWHIYKPQLTSVTSLANRATGAFLSVGRSPFLHPRLWLRPRLCSSGGGVGLSGFGLLNGC